MGADDFAEGSGELRSNSVTGSYVVHNDGTGQITLKVGSTTLNFAITMVSSSKLYLIEADSAVNAMGIAEKQAASALNAAASRTYIFQPHSLNSAHPPTAQVGRIKITNGSISGSVDVNQNGLSNSLTLTGGTFNVPDATFARGTATLTDSSPAT